MIGHRWGVLIYPQTQKISATSGVTRKGEGYMRACEGIDFLAKNIGQPMIDKLKPKAIEATETMGCVCCERLSHDWLYPNLYIFEKSGYGQWESKCLACQIVFTSMEEHLGPVKNGRLGLLKGVGALITENETFVYATGKHNDRMAGVSEPLFDQVVNLAGYRLYGHAWENIPSNAPFLLITDFAVKKSALIKNLKVSRGLEAVYACSGDGRLDLAHDQLIRPQDLSNTPRKVVNRWIKLLITHATQYLARAERQELMQITNDHPELTRATGRLNADPHTRLETLYITRMLLLES